LLQERRLYRRACVARRRNGRFDLRWYDRPSKRTRRITLKAQKLATAALACALAGASLPARAQDGARRLVAIEAPQHDPLFVDAASLRRNGTAVTFKYLLDVLAPPDEDAKPSNTPRQWRSNEIEATIDCRKHTVLVRRLVTYSGARGTGTATAVHSFTAPGLKAEPIAPKSTFAYLEQHVCRNG
jgi:hypothetical protein